MTDIVAPADDRARLEADVARLDRSLPVYSSKLVWILMAVSIVDASDRTVLSTVFEDVKRAFDVSDSSLGFLSGAYSLLAGLSIIPFGFLADRMRRVTLIALGFLPWALAMFLQGGATSFAMMFGARMLLGSIEATNEPATQSLIGDYYRLETRSSMYGLHSMSGTLGYAVGLTVGGAVASAAGWRMAFVVWGVVGLLTATIILKILPEPQRGVADALYHAQTRLRQLDETLDPSLVAPAHSPAPVIDPQVDYRRLAPFQAVLYVLRIPTIWLLYLGVTIGLVLSSALATWTVSYYRRYHGMSAAGAAGVLALSALLGVGGILWANRRNNAYVRNGRPERRLAFAAIANVAAALCFLGAFMSSALLPAVLLFIPGAILINVPAASLSAIGADVVVPHMRGRAAGIRGVLRLVGSASGPIIFGLLSDALGLRSALMATVPFAITGALIPLIAIRTYPADFARARSEAYRQNLLEEAEAS